MTTDKQPLSDRELDALLAAARRETPEPSNSLMAAVLSDAADVAASRRPASNARRTGPGRFAAFVSGIGGWQGVATVAASGVLGLWVGYSDLSDLPLVGDLELRVDLMLNGDAGFDPMTTFDDFTLDG